MKLDDLLPLLTPVALAALEAGLADSLNEETPDDAYCMLLAVSEAVRAYGHSLWGEDYAYLAGSISEAIEDTNAYIG